MLPDRLRKRLKIPVMAAPMFLVSGPALVIAACRAGVIGSFPTANCRTVDERPSVPTTRSAFTSNAP